LSGRYGLDFHDEERTMLNTEDTHIHWEDYVRAEKFLPWNLKKRIFNAEVKPEYIGKPEAKPEKFWYLNKGFSGKQFKQVDPESDLQEPAFDHLRLAASLSQASGKHCTHLDLPFDAIEFLQGNKIRFKSNEEYYTCDLGTYEIEKIEYDEKKKPDLLLSPDEKWAAFRKDFNIFVRNLENGDEIQLTHDGIQFFDYGSSPDSNTMAVTLRANIALIPPMAIWSKDSKKLVTQRLDQRQVKDLHLLQFVPPEGQRPVLHSYRYAMAGDEHLTREEIVILDVENQRKVVADCGPRDARFMGPVELKQVWWSEDSRKVYYVSFARDHKTIWLYEIDASSGKSRVILEETGSTYVELTPVLGTRPNVLPVNDGKEVIWPSERDGWANLYRYEASTGALLNRITAGPMVVWEIKRVDEEEGWVYFTGGCREEDRDPYYQHLYRARLDGSGLQLLTPEDAFHSITFSPGGRYFVDTYSRVNLSPITVLRTCDGELVRVLEEADASLLEEMGWYPPEPFSVKARDGVTAVYGVMYRPSNFDPHKSYPVIDSIYPGPQHIRSPKSFEPDMAHSLAELGFIVVTFDGLGNMGRDKANHDVSYGKFTEAGGLEDHIIGLRQLADRFSFIDLSRVGIYGHSGGGFASTKAILTYPDFFKVAVSSAGNHDQRGYLADWGELYNGLMDGDNFVEQANPHLAGNLKGKLLLIAGDMDDNVHPALTMQVIDALVNANKDFDMLILPNRNHTFSRDAYFLRKLWDYFVRHLLGEEPPAGYAINEKDIPPFEFSF
jgi:dipeptidyl-peptidase-4